MLGFGVCPRAYYLSYSFHGTAQAGTIFSPYFLIPFLFVANILLLELGIVSQQKNVIRLALLLPAGLVALALHRRWHYLVPLGALGTVAMQIGWAASFFTVPEAVEVPLIAAERPSDIYLDFVSSETMKTLDPHVKRETIAEIEPLVPALQASEVEPVEGLRSE